MIILGILGGQEIILIFIVLLIFLLPIIAMWKLFEKANKPGWAVIIPIYNIIVFMEIIGKPWWWLFLWLIPYLNIIWIIYLKLHLTNILNNNFHIQYKLHGVH
jgi:hypothetical protein